MAAKMNSVTDRTPQTLTTPVRLAGPVVKGFGRGSKQLGIPTANLPVQQNEDALQSLGTGIYYGWARVGSDPTFYKTVLSIGWNPFFQNAQKTIEPYLMATFAQDFYGEQLTVLVTGFLRPELNFPSLEALVEAIHTDIRVAGEELDKPEQVALKATV